MNKPGGPNVVQEAIPPAAHTHVDVAIALVFSHPREAAPERLLICQRKANTVLGGFWEFPGGKRAPGESLADCVQRELREEVGIEVDLLAHLQAIEHTYPHAHVSLTPFICRHRSGNLQLLAVADARWIAPAEVRHYTFPPANLQLVESAAQGLAHILSLATP